MKRIGNIYYKICSMENLKLADQKARKGKQHQYGIKVFDKNPEINLLKLRQMLKYKKYKTSEYTTFTVFEPKERVVYRLPYFPDRITHHAIMIHLEPIFTACFTADTYSCIKGRGIHGALRNLKKALRDVDGTQYCLKMDIRKFYPSIDHQILKKLLRTKFKDPDLLWLMDEIIDSADGVPIGNYLSQYFANFYLTAFDHWIKEVLKEKYYFRYADDLVFLSPDKDHLHRLRDKLTEYLETNLKLTVKANHQIFPVPIRGIDFVGYRLFHTHILIRDRIKRNFARMLKKRKNRQSIASYKGLLDHADTKHLKKKLLTHE